MKARRILLLTAHRANRHLLEARLSREYQVLAAGGANVLDVSFDLGILDAPTLLTLKKEVQQRREQELPVFLPFPLFIPRANAPQTGRFLGKLVDDLILTPSKPPN